MQKRQVAEPSAWLTHAASQLLMQQYSKPAFPQMSCAQISYWMLPRQVIGSSGPPVMQGLWHPPPPLVVAAAVVAAAVVAAAVVTPVVAAPVVAAPVTELEEGAVVVPAAAFVDAAWCVDVDVCPCEPDEGEDGVVSSLPAPPSPSMLLPCAQLAESATPMEAIDNRAAPHERCDDAIMKPRSDKEIGGSSTATAPDDGMIRSFASFMKNSDPPAKVRAR